MLQCVVCEASIKDRRRGWGVYQILVLKTPGDPFSREERGSANIWKLARPGGILLSTCAVVLVVSIISYLAIVHLLYYHRIQNVTRKRLDHWHARSYCTLIAANRDQREKNLYKSCILSTEFDRPPNPIRDQGIYSTRAGSILTSAGPAWDFAIIS